MSSTHMSIHSVASVEFKKRFVSNGRCRSLVIKSVNFDGGAQEIEISLFGNTEDLELLPRAADFIDCDQRDAGDEGGAA